MERIYLDYASAMPVDPRVLSFAELTILLIAIGLAMDALAVSIASGLTIKDLRISNAATIALFFCSFQAFMPVIGWIAGLSARAFITGVDNKH